MTTELWEILVPTKHRHGAPIRTRYHRVWDKFVRSLSGGLTVLKPATGQWVKPGSNELIVERMIPVRIACTRGDIDKIVDYTLKYYSQDAVMAYRVSDEVIIRHS